MLKVGLTGGLASGKSFVSHALEELGCFVIRADELGHAVLQPGAEAYDAVVEEFGSGILKPDNSIDRKALARIVFKDPTRLAELSALVHPAVRARSETLFRDYAAAHPHGIAVYEAAIIVEMGSYRDFTWLIVAACSVEQQIDRAMARDGITREEVLDRLSRQMPLEQKLKHADYVVDTSGTKEQTTAQVRALYETLTGLHK